MNQLLQEKRDAEQFLRLIAPKYMGVYILNRSTDRFRDVLAPEAFRAYAKVSEGSYSDAMRLYRDEYVSCDYREVIDQVLDYDYVYNVLASGNQVDVSYRKKDGTLIRLKISRYSDSDENLSVWVYTNEDSEDALYGELGEARYRIQFDDNEKPVEFIGSESLSKMLYGLTNEARIPFVRLWEHMHPQDVDGVREELKEIHILKDSEATYEAEFRLQNKEQQYRWYRAIGKPVLNEKGKIVSVYGFLIDIHKHKEKNLLQQRFISGLSHEYVTVWVINHDLTVELYQQTKKGDHIAQEAIEEFAKENNYQKSMEKYASEYVCEEDREDFLRNVNYRVVRERIKTEKVYLVVFQRKFNGKIDYFQACFAQISEDTDDFVLGFKLVNDIVEHEKERNDRLEEEKQILESLSSDFTAIYYLEVNSGKFEPVHIQNETNASELIKSCSGYKDFYEYAYQYAMRYIPKDEQPEFLWWFSRDNLKSLLKTQVSLTQNYRCYPNAQNHQYFETKVVKVSEDEESCHVLLGFRYIDDIIKKEKATQKRLQNALEEIKRSNETISAIAKSYSSIYKVDFETDTYERITGSDVIPKTGCASEKMFDVCEQDVAPEYRNIIHQFTNIETLTSRLEKEKDVLAEYRMADGNWHKLRIIVSKRNANGKAIQAIATIRIISETKRKELNLFFEAEQAKREAKIKTRFLQSMSHDMRTPLNGIAGMLHIADQNPKDLELQKTTRNKIHQSLNYLISLVNDILDMNDLESDHFTEEEVDFDITKLVGNMNIDAQQLAQEKNIQYVLDWYEGQLSHSSFRGFPIYLSRILSIVVQNAVKFTPENGEIHVWMNEKCLDDSTSLLEFRCKDNGIGMSQDFIQHAFDLFAQEDSSSRSTYQGTGLSLSIAKKLVEYMHGNIQLESEKGVGTTVYIQIPFKLGRSIENKTKFTELVSLEGLCVLVAEDNDLNMEIVEYMLERNGIQIVCAKDGQEVIDLFEKSEVNEFDFILMDIMMPKLNGLDATRKIRALKRLDAKTIPIIAMSANAFVEDIMNSKLAGMNMHLAKPLDETKLINALKQCKKDEE
ncbi:MAG: ATP-binding protein [Holdemanella porci]|uniref:PAS domain-containing hybrid sensor histidine kinase/response regulator n=1 Tax=Holdemanella porci TaxID=2652276 RepID=UPI00242D7AAB|nr:PAS domain-containing hybrid sensor histidine kinase/response regulator [Holdemanella porci]MDD6451956.1 ATP-binding protein [Holdemanella porci]